MPTQDLKQHAFEAMRFVSPIASELIRLHDKKGLHIVVADPRVKAGAMDLQQWIGTGGILLEHSIGERKEWHKNYQDIARAKTFLSAREGLSTREIQTLRPYLLEPGDTTYFGSAHRHGVTVGTSGHFPTIDEMISEVVLDVFRGLHLQSWKEPSVDKDGFLE